MAGKHRVSQRGSIHTVPLLLVVSAVGLIAFLLISSVVPFKGGIFGSLFSPHGARAASTINSHDVSLDGSGKLLSWYNQDKAYDHTMFLAWDFLKNKLPIENHGGVLTKPYLTNCCFSPDPPYDGGGLYHNPAGLYGMFVDSLIYYYPYSGDNSLIPMVQEMLDFQLAHGTTVGTWNWPNVPFASAPSASTTYSGDGVPNLDGMNGIEPDKVGELGMGYLKFYELTGNVTYLNAAINCANALASHVRTGDATHSPWPFRVDGQSGAIREEYTANAVGPVKLFDELIRLNQGQVASYQTARNTAWNWVLQYPMQTNQWHAYFEDIGRDTNLNQVNQLIPMETARYILERPDPATVDPNWQTHVPGLISWVQTVFGLGPFNSAWGINEQSGCCDPQGLGSHTSRWASVNAQWYAKTGDLTAKENAYRSLNYATYFAQESGVVAAHFSSFPEWWFTDGYADYIKHFMEGIGAVPEWSPQAEDHIVHSTSIIKAAGYSSSAITYNTFDPSSTEIARIYSIPQGVTAGGVALPLRADLNSEGWTYASSSGVLKVRHDNASDVVISIIPNPNGTPPPSSIPTATPAPTLPPGQQTVIFDDAPGMNQVLNGQYPSGVINWGSNAWYLSGPWGGFTTKSISFNSSSATSVSFSFVTPATLNSIQALNGGSGLNTITLSCSGNPTVTQQVLANQVATINTGWTNSCVSVTVGSSNGWNTNFDNLVYSYNSGPTPTPSPTPVPTATPVPTPTPSPTPVPTATPVPTSTPVPTPTPTPPAGQTIIFDDLSGQNVTLNGQYPTGVINWGTNKWFLSAPWGLFTTKSVSFRTASQRNVTFDFVTPKRLISVQAYNGGTGSSTVKLSCTGNTTKSQTVAAGAMATISTGWTANCTTVTVDASNSWNTNFDNLVIQ